MTNIRIKAPIERCFDAARDIELHTKTVWPHTRERVIAGRISGPINANETVTFQATHLLVRQTLTSRITEFQQPVRFTDEMVSGAFRTMKHKHMFRKINEQETMMTDILEFSAPMGLIGLAVERLVLRRYMQRFLEYRNQKLKSWLEDCQREGMTPHVE
ncbi:cell division protein [Paenibacillus sp. GCM10023252]|uniref:SRPBCC family protein n=1 Tax=Paenibacillus sp. GCM10023252 TaxID=3252649 RepID=UPI00361B8C45